MWFWLAGAIVSEVAATLALRASAGFTRLVPTVILVVGYGFAFYALSQALKLGMNVGVAYAVWSAIGVALIATVGAVFLHESLSPVQIGGLVLIIAGVVALELGRTTSH
ncbi:DMT family transporter [Asanoa iriomotensis]|uniref:QacE family quaternary ammonium compound efflux SMR transporter n=1 Tax=Asanoa iriomotensis TaxID=234613 RepID=A0ABQ4CA39_9ACTN|nr:multidrug efflux SMR transporter [Asanoa iriomotensis]GIF59170.1 QacE family quaternary ammonium compound efflux SMR transporter [Asanoa iriomotensis]